MSTQKAVVDELDLRLLERLQENSRQTCKRLGEKIGLSSTAVLRRIRKLRACGLIIDEVAILAPDKLGFGVTTIVHITLKSESATNRRFGERIAAHPAVSQCYYVTGNADFVMIASFRTMMDYQAFAGEYFLENKLVRRFSTQVVLRSVKRTMRLPIFCN